MESKHVFLYSESSTLSRGTRKDYSGTIRESTSVSQRYSHQRFWFTDSDSFLFQKRHNRTRTVFLSGTIAWSTFLSSLFSLENHLRLRPRFIVLHVFKLLFLVRILVRAVKLDRPWKPMLFNGDPLTIPTNYPPPPLRASLMMFDAW